MSENGDYPSEVTIKVRLSDEDYQDIHIDWSDESYEHKQQLFIQKIASFIGISADYIRFIVLDMANIQVIDNHIFNIESHYIRRRPSPRVVNDIFMQSINDGDSFFICPLLGLIDPEFPFDLCIVLVASERVGIQPTECTPSYCKILNTRALLNRKKAIIFNSELLSKVKAAFTEERFQGQNQWINILLYFNILQYFNMCCRYNRMRQKRLYLPNRG